MKKVLFVSCLATLGLMGCKCKQKTEPPKPGISVIRLEPPVTLLENTSWALVTIDSQDKKFVANPENRIIYLNFSDKYISTTDGCNSIGATFIQQGNKVQFDDFTSTKKYCDQEYMQKHGYSWKINSVKTFKIENGMLKFFDEDNKVLATFENIK